MVAAPSASAFLIHSLTLWRGGPAYLAIFSKDVPWIPKNNTALNKTSDDHYSSTSGILWNLYLLIDSSSGWTELKLHPYRPVFCPCRLPCHSSIALPPTTPARRICARCLSPYYVPCGWRLNYDALGQRVEVRGSYLYATPTPLGWTSRH